MGRHSHKCGCMLLGFAAHVLGAWMEQLSSVHMCQKAVFQNSLARADVHVHVANLYFSKVARVLVWYPVRCLHLACGCGCSHGSTCRATRENPELWRSVLTGGLRSMVRECVLGPRSLFLNHIYTTKVVLEQKLDCSGGSSATRMEIHVYLFYFLLVTRRRKSLRLSATLSYAMAPREVLLSAEQDGWRVVSTAP